MNEIHSAKLRAHCPASVPLRPWGTLASRPHLHVAARAHRWRYVASVRGKTTCRRRRPMDMALARALLPSCVQRQTRGPAANGILVFVPCHALDHLPQMPLRQLLWPQVPVITPTRPQVYHVFFFFNLLTQPITSVGIQMQCFFVWYISRFVVDHI